jgi:hypothetical protein
MGLGIGQSVALVIQRTGTQTNKYRFFIRTSSTSSFDEAHGDFQLGPHQVTVKDLGERIDFEAALQEAFVALQTFK